MAVAVQEANTAKAAKAVDPVAVTERERDHPVERRTASPLAVVADLTVPPAVEEKGVRGH